MGILSYGYKARNAGKAIKSVPIAKNLTKKRADTDKALKELQSYKDFDKKLTGGENINKYKKITGQHIKNIHGINTKYEKRMKDIKAARKRDEKKVIGAGAATAVGATVAHGAAKKKFPKYKKVMESDIVIKDGKLKLKNKKEK
tara:strand:- start:192 stop:623 length:432 start_codon:yes stop_codon:yes gene_type:complete